MSRLAIGFRVALAAALFFVWVRMVRAQQATPHAALNAAQRQWIALVLMMGISVLFVIFGTRVLVDWGKLRALPAETVAKAVPLRVGLLAALGLACTAFGVHALLFY